MKLSLAYFADAAQLLEGKLYLLGGGLTRYSGHPFPLAIPSLSAVIHFAARPDEFGTARRVTGFLERSGGRRLAIQFDTFVVPLADPLHPDRPNMYTLVLALAGVEFPE